MDYAYFYYKVMAPGQNTFVGQENIVDNKVFKSSPSVTNIGITACEGTITVSTAGTYEITYSIAGTDVPGPTSQTVVMATDLQGPLPGSDMVFSGGTLLTQSITFLANLSAGEEIGIVNTTPLPTDKINLQDGSLVGITIEQIS